MRARDVEHGGIRPVNIDAANEDNYGPASRVSDKRSQSQSQSHRHSHSQSACCMRYCSCYLNIVGSARRLCYNSNPEYRQSVIVVATVGLSLIIWLAMFLRGTSSMSSRMTMSLHCQLSV
jgi:hypothetical protein